jgi:hypothetical protein
MIEIVAKAEARVESPFVKTADDAEYQLIQTAHKAANAGNWVIGECAHRWFHTYGRGRTDAAFAEMIEQSEDKVWQCRRVWEKFSTIYQSFRHLTWSHFRAVVAMDDAPELLEWAEDCKATVQEMLSWGRCRNTEKENTPKVMTPESRVLPPEKQNTQGVRRDRTPPAESGKAETASVVGDKPDWSPISGGSQPLGLINGKVPSNQPEREKEETRTVDLALNQIAELLHFAFDHGTEDERDSLAEIIRPIWLQLAPPSLLPAKVPQVQAGLAVANTVVNEWNMIDGVTVCRAVTPARRKKIAERMRDAFWKQNWREAIDKIRNLKCLQGANDQNWRADIDWFLRPDTVAKVLEGKYDNWKPSNATAHDRRKSTNDSAFDEVFG